MELLGNEFTLVGWDLVWFLLLLGFLPTIIGLPITIFYHLRKRKDDIYSGKYTSEGKKVN